MNGINMNQRENQPHDLEDSPLKQIEHDAKGPSFQI